MITTEKVIPTLIPNTTMMRVCKDGLPLYFDIIPNPNFVLHDKVRDVDSDTDERKILGYTTHATCGVNYNFATVAVTDENGVVFTAYGEREFAARIVTE
jgi:hypothetical protein